jgi:hypothetical protein
MADSQIHSLALQDILLSIAEGLNKAQHELNNMAPYDQYGRPNTIYHVPYLDFNLQVVTEFAGASGTQTAGAGIGAAAVAAALPPVKAAAKKGAAAKAAVAATAVAAAYAPAALPQRNLIRFMPVQAVAPVDTATKNTARIESSISGRFVAVVPNEGLPQVFIMSETSPPVIKDSGYFVRIKATIKNVVGEVLTATRVEFNFDAAATTSLSGMPVTVPPVFSKNEGLTDATGNIETEVMLDKDDFNNGITFCFVINTSNIQKNISVSK